LPQRPEELEVPGAGTLTVSVCLLDVTVLLALAWQTHVHHPAAHRWFGENSGAGWATCSLTQLGFVRLAMGG
jgi:predicted nucleic acid-binding protein